MEVPIADITRNTSIAASTGLPPAPADNRAAPLLGRYRSKDRYIRLAGYFPDHCQAICAAVGLPEYADPSNSAFRSRVAEIEAAVEVELATRTTAAWDRVFRIEKVVAGGVQSPEETIASGQPAARQLIQVVASTAGPQQVTTAGYHINTGVFGPNGDVPLLGQHSTEILLELGYTSDDIADLIATGALIQGPKN